LPTRIKRGILDGIMQSLFILYSALAVFGVGVTVIDLFGVFEHAGGSGHPDDSGHDDGAGHDDGGGHDDGHELATHDPVHHHGSYIASADSATRFVARTIGALRMVVYFSLGAGPTGLFAVLTGVAPGESLAWSAGAGVSIAILARALRSFIRKDLDSSIAPEEFIMDEATMTVSIIPGAMGKAAVRRYGTEHELFVRAKDIQTAFIKGEKVRIVDFDDDCYWIEPV